MEAPTIVEKTRIVADLVDSSPCMLKSLHQDEMFQEIRVLMESLKLNFKHGLEFYFSKKVIHYTELISGPSFYICAFLIPAGQ